MVERVGVEGARRGRRWRELDYRMRNHGIARSANAGGQNRGQFNWGDGAWGSQVVADWTDG